jgi:hypothetical protein
MIGTQRLQSPSPRIQLLFTCPRERFRAYEDRLRDCAAGQLEPIEVERFERPETLARRARFSAFVSPAQPTLLLFRDGTLVGEALGDLPAYELRGLIRRALATSR